jgi:hypothetical protein
MMTFQKQMKDIIGEYAWEYLEVQPYPFTNIKLTKSDFENKVVHIFGKYIEPACSGSGTESECYFGKVKNENIFFTLWMTKVFLGMIVVGQLQYIIQNLLK